MSESQRLKIEHRTVYTYGMPVVSSYNETRLLPQTEEGQLTLEAVVRTDPPAPQQRYWDYWGSQVVAFDLHVPHERLVVTGRSVVETTPPTNSADDGITWGGLAEPAVQDSYVETLAATKMTSPVEDAVELALELRAGRTPRQFFDAVIERVNASLRYQKGSTGVNTTAAQAWSAGEGVCQDLAHVALMLLRAGGVPSRYVSGYLQPRSDAQVGDIVHGESHAWVEAWLGGWVAADPTSNRAVGQNHVVVARGRDYTDVPPLLGLYSGASDSTLEVAVSVERLR